MQSKNRFLFLNHLYIELYQLVEILLTYETVNVRNVQQQQQ